MNAISTFVVHTARTTWIYLLAQLLVTSTMWESGFGKLFSFQEAVTEMAGTGLHPPVFFAALVIFVQLAGSFLAVFGKKWAWLGSGALIVFTIGTVLLVHDFWNLTGTERAAEYEEFLDHLTLIGGLTLSALISIAKYHRSDR